MTKDTAPASDSETYHLSTEEQSALKRVLLRSASSDELAVLRKRVKAQRAELRRLNKTLGPYWAGFRRGIAYEDSIALRKKMIAAFGHEAVFKAEHAKEPKQ